MSNDRRVQRVRRWFVERALLMTVSLLAILIATATLVFSVVEGRRHARMVDQFVLTEAGARAGMFNQLIVRMLDQGVIQAKTADASRSVRGEREVLHFVRFGDARWNAFGLYDKPQPCDATASGWSAAHYLVTDGAKSPASEEFGRSLFLTIALPTCEVDPYRRLEQPNQTLEGIDHFVVSASVGEVQTQWHGVIEAGPNGMQPELWRIQRGVEPARWVSWRTISKRQGMTRPLVSVLAAPVEKEHLSPAGVLLRVELPLSLLDTASELPSVESALGAGVHIALSVSFVQNGPEKLPRDLPVRPIGAEEQTAFAGRIQSYAKNVLNGPDKFWVTFGPKCENHLKDSELDARSLLPPVPPDDSTSETLYGERGCIELSQHGVLLWVRPTLAKADTHPSSNALWFGTAVLGAVGVFYAAIYGLVIRRLRGITKLLRDKGQRIVEHYRGDRPPRDEIDLLARAAADGIRSKVREAEEAQAQTAERVTVALGLKHVIANDLALLGPYFERSKEEEADAVVQGIMRWIRSFCEAETAYDFVGKGDGGLVIVELGELVRKLDLPATIQATLEVPAGTKIVVEPFLLGAAVGQLLDNAKRETSGDLSRINFRTQWADDERVELIVQNEGRLRLDPELIFDMRVSDSERSKLGRRGLGLYLVRLIMSRMAGTAHAHQDGDTVVFALRLHTMDTGADVLARDAERRRVRGDFPDE